MPKIKERRIGEKRLNNYGSLMAVEEYNNKDDILVKFLDYGNTVRTTWRYFCEGKVKNVYDKSVLRIGYIGEGEHQVSIDCKLTIQYITWRSMLKRCYNVEYSKKDNAYMDCEVCDEWFNFQNFAKWYDENFYEIEGEKIHLDKDILIKGNKIYSPETCVFVPARINILFAKSKSKRGDYPIGVHLDKRTNKFISSCRDKTKYDYLGSFEVIEYAFQTYKIHKEKLIKQVAEDYKEKIPAKLYNAMINYQVEITD